MLSVSRNQSACARVAGDPDRRRQNGIQPQEVSAMPKNMGTIDRVVRILIAVAIVALYLGGQISGTTAIILGVIAVAFLLTSLVGTCPAYLPFHLSTRKKA
jgi:hypothetical protein